MNYKSAPNEAVHGMTPAARGRTRAQPPMRSKMQVPLRLPDIILSFDATLAVGTISVLALALVLGGGTEQGYWSDAIVQLASLPLIGVAAARLGTTNLSRSTKWSLILLCVGVALPLLQLVPLPPQVWSALPGRAEFAKTYAIAGVDVPWAPLSLDPAATWYSFAALLPAMAIFLATLTAGWKLRRVLVGLFLVVSVISVLLGFLQVAGGPESPLRFFSITNVDRPVGFFANANHQSALLYSAVPFGFALALAALRRQKERRSFRGNRPVTNPKLVIKLGVLAFVLGLAAIGLISVQSRAGLGLGLIAGLSCVVMSRISTRGSARLSLILLGVILLALTIYLQFAAVNLAERMEGGDDVSAMRATFAAVTWRAALTFLPFGSGFGSFAPIYDIFSPQTLLGHRYVNHAHNDWLELLLIGGVPAIAFAACFLIWFGAAISRLWWGLEANTRACDLQRAASVAVLLLLVHSAVDYPLRTTALSVLFALGCAFLLEPPRPHSEPNVVLSAAQLPDHPVR